MKIDARGLYYRDLNGRIKEDIAQGAKALELYNVFGQRYIGTGLRTNVKITIHGTPGNDLAAFMDGPQITVYGDAQDGCGNTMNEGEVVVHGHAGDIIGYSMRGGKIFVRDDVGYRAGIHMKEYLDKRPIIVIGGTAQDFLGEYMAGGVLIVLGLNVRAGGGYRMNFVGTGMHGGVIFIRGDMKNLSEEVKSVELEERDHSLLGQTVQAFAAHFGFDAKEILGSPFTKLLPVTKRPYGGFYAY